MSKNSEINTKAVVDFLRQDSVLPAVRSHLQLDVKKLVPVLTWYKSTIIVLDTIHETTGTLGSLLSVRSADHHSQRKERLELVFDIPTETEGIP